MEKGERSSPFEPPDTLDSGHVQIFVQFASTLVLDVVLTDNVGSVKEKLRESGVPVDAYALCFGCKVLDDKCSLGPDYGIRKGNTLYLVCVPMVMPVPKQRVGGLCWQHRPTNPTPQRIRMHTRTCTSGHTRTHIPQSVPTYVLGQVWTQRMWGSHWEVSVQTTSGWGHIQGWPSFDAKIIPPGVIGYPGLHQLAHHLQYRLGIRRLPNYLVRRVFALLVPRVTAVTHTRPQSLRAPLLAGVLACGLEQPCALQSQLVPVLVARKDTIVQSQYGSVSGMSAAAGISILQQIDLGLAMCQAVILLPPGASGQSIHYNYIKHLCARLDITSYVCIGGQADVRVLSTGVQVVAGTPPLILKAIHGGALCLKGCKVLCLCCADDLIRLGHRDSLNSILRSLPDRTQRCLFAHTMSSDVKDMGTLFTRDPIKILVQNMSCTLETIKQFYVDVGREELKFETFCDLYESTCEDQPAVVHCNSRRKAIWLGERLSECQYPVATLHSGKGQRERKLILDNFHSSALGTTTLLVTHDLLLRELQDLQEARLVMNYDMPATSGDYFQRVHRELSRFSRKKVAISLVTPGDAPVLQDIERSYNTAIKEMPFLNIGCL